ncbi:MAG: class I SAM-dependent methyltransferase [Vampirovibrionales bacterium]|nr:class I SAM-dependent methyltransferase [Vampirovibrionales bacterium]
MNNRWQQDPSIKSDWYIDFFDALVADFWQGSISDACTEKEVSFLLKQFGQPETASCLLDLMCGAGRHIPALAEAGFALTGLDVSQDMLQHAKTACQNLPSVSFFRADGLDLPSILGETPRYDGAFCLGNSLGYLDASGMQRMLGGVSQLLKPGARLVLHSSVVAETLFSHWDGKMEMVAGGVRAYIENTAYDSMQSRVFTKFILRRELDFVEEEADASDAQASTSPPEGKNVLIAHYVYTTGEISRWLSAFGVLPVAFYGDCDGGRFELGESEHWYGVFEKQG